MIGQPFIVLNTTDSTNNHAMKEARRGVASHGMVFFALEQTNGKGQMNKSWLSHSGENILMSVVLDCCKYELNQQFQLSMAISLACYELLKKYTVDEMSVKWPNDLYWRDRKAGGILIENIINGSKWEKAVVGIGINVNQVDFGEMDRKPVSIKQISGKQYDPKSLAKELCVNIGQLLEKLESGKSDELLCRYNEVLYKKNKAVTFCKGNQRVDLVVKHAMIDGQLSIDGYHSPLLAWGELDWVG